MSDKLNIAVRLKSILGEGAIWHPEERRLYWVDIEGCLLHIYDPVSGENVSYPTGSRIGTVVPVEGGGLLLALQDGIYFTHPGSTNRSLVAKPIEDPMIRFNDGKCDPAGRFWVGTMHLESKDAAAVLYKMDTDGAIETMIQNVTVSNGIAWSSDHQRMYYVDTPTSMVQCFDYDMNSGTISNGRTVIEIPGDQGKPDGMTIDRDDHLWIALWGGGGVACYDPQSGKLIQKIDVPAPHTTSCAFGGPALDTLFITTAREGLSGQQLEEFPQSGNVFSIKPGAKGVKAAFFKGNFEQ